MLCMIRRMELCAILRDLGAKTISWLDDPAWVRNYETPGSFTPFFDESKYTFLKNNSRWMSIVNERTTSWPDNLQISFSYDDDFSVNNEIVSVLLKKLNISAATFYGQETFPRPVIFAPVSFPVQVVFFSRKDYERINREHIIQNWGPCHVQCLLKAWDMPTLSQLVADKKVSSAAIMGCTKEKQIVDLLGSSDNDFSDIKELFRKLKLLGEVEEERIMEKVEAAASELLAARRDIDFDLAFGENSPEGGIDDPAEHLRGDGLIHANPAAVASLESGEYNMVMVGSGGSGKTSFLRHIIGSSEDKQNNSKFNVDEAPTVGPQLYQCSLGSVKVECWDTPGQDLERRAILLHTRKADIIFAVYDITSAESLRVLGEVVADIIKNGEAFCELTANYVLLYAFCQ